MSDGLRYYFAYGSNLDPDQMADRLPDSEPVGSATLRDYRLDFGGHSPHWDGAPATVWPIDGESVRGFVYQLTDEAVAILDSYEGHPVRYERTSLAVDLDDGRTVEAAVYIKSLEEPGPPPPDEYFEQLRAAYERLGFETAALFEARERAG